MFDERRAESEMYLINKNFDTINILIQEAKNRDLLDIGSELLNLSINQQVLM
jgi:hypothetical protein